MGVHKCSDGVNGDSMLSPFERKLWSLTYSCLYKFMCPVIFNVFGPNCKNRIDQRITFFVPSDNQNAHLVIDYLHEELDGDIHVGEVINENEYAYGTVVEIHEFSGVDFYLERDVAERMAHQAMESFMKKVENLKRNKS